MTDENQKKLKEINEKLKEIMLRHMEKPDVCASAINVPSMLCGAANMPFASMLAMASSYSWATLFALMR